MSDQSLRRARAFLEAKGFVLENNPRRLDAALLSSLDSVSRRRLETIWANRNLGFSTGLEMYQVPRDSRQAALLFSQDWPRAAATMAWFGDLVAQLGCTSVAEVGCGAGFLLAYIQATEPSVDVFGIDGAANLAEIAAALTGRPISAGDYLGTSPQAECDLVICDFGFDLAKFAPSRRPHESRTVAGQLFCPSCSDDMAEQFVPYLRAWRAWGRPDAALAVSGRFGNFGALRALQIAARRVNWEMSLDLSRVLKIRNIARENERFPAVVFTPSEVPAQQVSEEEAAQFFGS